MKIQNIVNFYSIAINHIYSGPQGFLLGVKKYKETFKSNLEKNILTHVRHIFAHTEAKNVVPNVSRQL